MLVGRPDHVVKFMGRKVDDVFFVPLDEFLTSLFFGEPKETKLGSKPNGAIVSVPGIHVAFPDFLDSRARESEVTQVPGSAEAVTEGLLREVPHLSLYMSEELGSGGIFLHHDTGKKPRFICDTKWARFLSKLSYFVRAERFQLVEGKYCFIEP